MDAVAVALSLLAANLAGWAAHWAMHRRWSGRLHRAHMTHHLKTYPPWDLVSDEYRSAGKDSSTLVFAPIVAGAVLGFAVLARCLGASWGACAAMVAASAAAGWAHDYVHDSFHVRESWMGRFRAYREVRRLHFVHHRDMRRNLGIVWFGWDRLFRTFRS